jgi:MFS family permease
VTDTLPEKRLPVRTALRVLLPFALGYFLSYLYRVVNAVIAPDLVAEVGLSSADLGLLTSTYFLTFAAAQLPLGVLLDRFEPRRVEAVLLAFAAAGALVFSVARTPVVLVVGRALIGFGVSACLMAAFRAFVLWFPRGKLPLVNGVQLAAGGLGALTATAPVEAALHVTDWRGVFQGVAALTVVAAVVIATVVPRREPEDTGVKLRAQLRGVAEIFGSRVFWRIAPVAIVTQSTNLAVQGLWAGPWLRDVAGLERGPASMVLLGMMAAMTAGYLLLGAAAERVGRRGVRAESFSAVGMAAFMGVQVLLVAGWTGAVPLIWILYGFLGTSGVLCYAGLTQSFPAHLAGRVNTALNLLVFVAAFVTQWGLGAVIGFWPPAGNGYDPAGYRVGFALLLVLQIAGLVWYLLPRGEAGSAALCTE